MLICVCYCFFVMNENDIKRFARYRPGYIEPPETDLVDDIDIQKQPLDNTNNNPDKKHQLGYIDKITIDKNKLIIDAIAVSYTHLTLPTILRV